MKTLTITLALLVVSPSALAAQGKPTFQDLIAGRPYCADSIEDQAAPGNCIAASSIPAIGMLYPLSADFFVDPATGALRVNGQVVAGVDCTATGSNATVSGGLENHASGVVSVVGGGFQNTAGTSSTVAGGRLNAATSGSAIGGGQANEATGAYSTVGGGIGNAASGNYSVVPGGLANEASGEGAFAAGFYATVDHDGSFVWSGDAFDPMASTAPHQFLINAPGGVGIGTNVPDVALDVVGVIEATDRISTSNPNNPAASLHLSWSNDVARLRVGGSGVGAQNGFEFQTIGDNSLMRITGSGNVGIGTTTPASRLDVNGTIRCTSLTQTSDARLKTNVSELEGALAKVGALRGVSFDWDRERLPDADGTRQVGFLAQEVREVLPEAVVEDDEGTLSVAYTQLVPLLVEALKEQQAEIDELRALAEEMRRE